MTMQRSGAPRRSIRADLNHVLRWQTEMRHWAFEHAVNSDGNFGTELAKPLAHVTLKIIVKASS